MLRKTYTILAVALTATACGGTVETSEPDSSKEQLSGGQESSEPDSSKEQLSGAQESSESVSSKEQLSGNQVECDTEAVNAELAGTSLDDAVANRALFRCLCDDEGYPLVGNINAKAVTTASELCGALREKDLL